MIRNPPKTGSRDVIHCNHTLNNQGGPLISFSNEANYDIGMTSQPRGSYFFAANRTSGNLINLCCYRTRDPRPFFFLSQVSSLPKRLESGPGQCRTWERSVPYMKTIKTARRETSPSRILWVWGFYVIIS